MLSRLALVLVLLSLSACASYECRPVRVPVPEVGDERSSVHAAFGEPVAFQRVENGRIDAYQLRVEECGGAVFPVPYIGILPLWGGSDAFWTIGYASDDRVLQVNGWPALETVEEALEGAAALHESAVRRREALHAHAEAGDATEAAALAREFGDPEPLRRLAASGDVAARIALVAGGYDGPLQPETLDDAELDRLSTADAFDLYESLVRARRDATDRLAWQLLCHAADGDMARAQSEVADWHRELYSRRWVGFAGIEADDRIAYLWYSLAASHGLDEARMKREIMARGMQPSEVAEAERLIADWRPGLCADLGA